MTIPDLYVIGAPKAGTTSLCSWLAQHPDVYFSVPKEPFFWAADYPGMRAHYGFDDLAAYEALFNNPRARDADYRAEGSTTYLYSERAVPDILDTVPDARFVVALRNPVDLVVSYHRTQVLALNEPHDDFECAWRASRRRNVPAALPGGPGPASPPGHTPALDPKLVDYELVARIGSAVSRLLTVTARDRVSFVLFDDVRDDPDRAWRQLTDSLGLPAAQVDLSAQNESTVAPRSDLLRRVTHRPPAALRAPVARLRQWSRQSSNPVVARAKAAMWTSRERPEISDGLRSELDAFLRNEVDLLETACGRDLSGWKVNRS